MRRTVNPVFPTAVIALIAVAPATGGEFWSSFQNGGIPAVSTAHRVRLNEVKWDAALNGYGQSSPVTYASLAYVTTVSGDNRDQYHLTAIRLTDGSEAWQHSSANPSPRENATYHSRAAPTPAVDDAGVICFFEGGLVVALTHDGSVRWNRNLVEEYGSVEARHGLAASVEQDDQHVFIWVERSEQPYIVCLSKETGDVIWKADGLGATSWSSPRLVPVPGGSHLVLSAIGQLAGLDPASGRRLWLMTDIKENSTPTPVPLGDGRFLMGATVGRGESGGGRAARSNGVVRVIPQQNGSWSADFEWRAKRATSSFASPIAHEGVAYFVSRAGVVYGLDAATGEELFAKRLDSSTWATPIAVGEQVFFFGRDGQVTALSGSGEGQTLTQWEALPQPRSPSTEGGPTATSGTVLYAAAWLEETVLFRRGDRLYAVRVR